MNKKIMSLIEAKTDDMREQTKWIRDEYPGSYCRYSISRETREAVYFTVHRGVRNVYENRWYKDHFVLHKKTVEILELN